MSFYLFVYLCFFFSFTVLRLPCCAWAFSSSGECWLLCCGVWTSHCCGFPCGAQALGVQASVFGANGLRSFGA